MTLISCRFIGGGGSSSDESYLQAHLVSGVGYFSFLLERLPEHFQWSSPLLAPHLGCKPHSYGFSASEGSTPAKKSSQRSKEVLVVVSVLMHRSLVCLGDLTRYWLVLLQHLFSPLLL